MLARGGSRRGRRAAPARRAPRAARCATPSRSPTRRSPSAPARSTRAVRAMLGAVDRSHAVRLVEALAAGDGARAGCRADELRGLGLSAGRHARRDGRLLQQMAVAAGRAGRLRRDDPERRAGAWRPCSRPTRRSCSTASRCTVARTGARARRIQRPGDGAAAHAGFKPADGGAPRLGAAAAARPRLASAGTAAQARGAARRRADGRRARGRPRRAAARHGAPAAALRRPSPAMRRPPRHGAAAPAATRRAAGDALGDAGSSGAQ